MAAHIEDLPQFVYHPDPLKTGSVRASDEVCVCCLRQRGYIYSGPVFAVEELTGPLCPWCVADGTAADRFEADFSDAYLAPAGIGTEVVSTITNRTPGFSGWQQERWLFHCGDGAAFLGVVGARELEGDHTTLESLRQELSESRWPAEQVDQYLASLDRDGQPTAYLFECRSCRTHLAYSDFT
ncbi:MAG: hypothetical protein JWN00_4721 [Actinomycetia bacterium]|nr:hypothetical protein [Actinomycetes bacterium]